MENNLEDIQRKSAVGVSNNITLRSEVINDNEKQANDDNPPLFWEKFFIREEFLKLYFQNLGINNNLKISRLTNIYDIKRKESNEKFLFAIIRYNITDEHLLEEGIKTDYEKIHKERLNLFYPETPELFDSSTNYLSLALSGLANLSNSKIFSNKNKENSCLKIFFDEIFSQNFEDDSVKYPKCTNPNFNDKILKINQNLNKIHNDSIKDLIGKKLEKIPKNDPSNDYFSLIFFKEGILYEFLSHNQEVIEIKQDINESVVREFIMRFIMDNNEKREVKYKYLNDVSIFLEHEKEEITEINTESEGAFIIIFTTILFISNFFLVNSGNVFYDFNKSITRLLEYDVNGTYLLSEQKISSYKDVFDYYNTSILKKIYDSTNNYITEIDRYILKDNDHESEDQPKNVTEIDLEFMNYYPLSMNYFCGMLMNFKLAQELDTIIQPDGEKYVIKNADISYYGGSFHENKTRSIIFDYYDDENPLSGSSFSFYYKPIINENQKEIQSAFFNYVIKEKIIFFSHTIIFYNPIHNVVLIYYRQFDLNPFGQIKTTKKVYGYSPFPNTILFTIIAINSLYLIGLLYIAFIVIRHISHQLINSFNTNSFTFEIYELIDVSVLTFNIISTIFFFSVYNFVPNFPIALTNKNMFLEWVNYGLTVKTYLEFTGFTMFLLMVRLVRFLYTAFPNFGIVFQTLNNARHEISAFVLMIFLILIGFFVASHVSFGSYSLNFFDIFDSFLEIFTMILGSFNFDDLIGMYGVYSPLAPYFFIFFMLFFNAILFNVFLSIILNNYGEIKRKNQKINEAYALLIKEKSFDFQNKLFNFLLCRDPNREENVIDKSKAKLKDNDEEVKVKVDKKTKGYDFFTKLKINYENLNISQIFSGDSIKREELEDNLKSKLVEIDRKRLKESLKDLEVDNESEFDQLYDTLCYIIFIIVFLVMILVQLRLGISSEIRLITEKFLSDKLGSELIVPHLFDSKISISNFIGMFYNATPYDTCDLVGNKTPKFFNQIANEDNIFTKPPYFRITVRILKYSLNSEDIEWRYFPLKIENPTVLDKFNCGSNGEKTERILIHEENGAVKNLVGQIHYFNKGDPRTPYECGGYVYYLNNTNPFCKDFYNKKTYNYTLTDFFSSLSSQSAGSLLLDSVLFNTYYRFVIYTQFSITQSLFGDNQFKIEISPLPINLISNDLDNLYRILIELIYYFFIFNFYIKKIKEIIEHLDVHLYNDFESDPEKEKFRESKSINRYFRFEFRKYESIGLWKAIGLILIKFFSRVCQFMIYFFHAFLDHLRAKIYNIIDLISLLISLILIIEWINITSLTHSLDFKFERINYPEPLQDLTEYLNSTINMNEEKFNSATSNNIMIANQLNELYKFYIYWMGVNSFIILMRMVQYFKFSKSVYNLVLILEKARNSIIFHFILMMFFFIGFGLWGFALYGHTLEKFRSIARTLLELFLILIGNINISDYSQSFWGILFLLLFCIIMILIIINVLTSIIIETYKESKNMQSQNFFDKKPMNLIENIVSITKMKYFIFINTIDNYMKYIKKFRKRIFDEKCYTPYSAAIEELENGNKGLYDYCSDYVFVMRSFYNEFDKYRSILESFTLEKKAAQKISDEVSSLYEKNLNHITKNNEISICTKIITYIILKISSTKYYSLLNIQDLNLNMKKKNFVVKSKSFRSKIKVGKTINDNDKEFKNLIDFNDENNKYLKEFSKRFYNSFSTSKSFDFIKKDLFIKDLKLSFNKRASKGITNLNSHLESYSFQKHTRKREYNTNFVLNCSNHRNITKYNKGCDNCIQMREYFDSIYILIYDILVKHYYLPKKMEKIEKALYLGYFINNFNEIYGFKHDINFYLSKIPKEKIRVFQEDLTKFINFESYEIIDLLSFSSDEYLNKNKNMKNQEDDIFLFSENDIKRDDENAGDTLIMQLYKSFCIWNALYLIIFKKFPEYVRKLKRKSFTYNYMEKIKSKLESKKDPSESTPYSELFGKIYRLDEYIFDKITNGDKLSKDIIISDFFDYIAKIKKKIDDIDLGERNFFEQDNKFYLDDIDFVINSDPVPKQIPQLRNEEKCPRILIDIWRSWKKKVKFYIFFGFNNNLASNDEMNAENFLKNDFMNMPKIEIYINKFFTNRHRAEIFKQSSFPNYFMNFLIQNFKEFLLKNHIADQVNLKIESIKDIIKFFHDMRINYMMVYKFFMESFDTQFSKLKNIASELDSQFHLTFNKIKKTVSNDENGNDFMKLFKLFISKAKFEKLSNYFEKQPLNEDEEDVEKFILENGDASNTNQVPQKENQESNLNESKEETIKESPISKMEKYDNFGSNEIFILFFSLDYDELLREFYMFLLIYLHEGNDFSIIYEFLERKAQFHLIQKYKFYCNYLIKRDESTKAENIYLDEKTRFNSMINYTSYLRERLESLNVLREKTLNSMSNKIMKQLNTFSID